MCVYTSTRSRIRIRIWITIHNNGRGGLSLDLNPVCLCVNATNLDQDLDQNPRVNGYGIHVRACLMGCVDIVYGGYSLSLLQVCLNMDVGKV